MMGGCADAPFNVRQGGVGLGHMVGGGGLYTSQVDVVNELVGGITYLISQISHSPSCIPITYSYFSFFCLLPVCSWISMLRITT